MDILLFLLINILSSFGFATSALSSGPKGQDIRHPYCKYLKVAEGHERSRVIRDESNGRDYGSMLEFILIRMIDKKTKKCYIAMFNLLT